MAGDMEEGEIPPPLPDPLCGCHGEACAFGDSLYQGAVVVNPDDADFCRECSWSDAARIVREIDTLFEESPLVRRMEAWVASVVAPRWGRSKGRWSLPPDEFRDISRVVHRVVTGASFRLRVHLEYTPATRFVMRHPRDAGSDTSATVMLKMPSPVGWIACYRGPVGLCYRVDSTHARVESERLVMSSYGSIWAEAEPPGAMPDFLPRHIAAASPVGGIVWHVMSPGVGGWIRAEKDVGVWKQRLDGTGIRHEILDVPGDVYGEHIGATRCASGDK